MEKKGQLKIQQMIFMVIAVALLFILVALFFLSYRTASLYEEAIETQREKAIGLVTKLAASPEFRYKSVTNGVDFDKAMALSLKSEYKDFWEIDAISIVKLYPLDNDEDCNIGNYPNCNKIIFFSDIDNPDISDSASAYVALCREDIKLGRVYDRCELALMTLGTKDLLAP